MIDTNKIVKQNIDAVLQFLPYFADQNNVFYTAYKDPNGIVNIEPYIYNQKVTDFVNTLYQHNFIQEFNWGLWTDEAKKFIENPKLLDQTDLEGIVKLLTTHIRADRFSSGHLASMIEKGHILRMLKRLDQIRKEKFL